jgi:hypothetical protein
MIDDRFHHRFRPGTVRQNQYTTKRNTDIVPMEIGTM